MPVKFLPDGSVTRGTGITSKEECLKIHPEKRRKEHHLNLKWAGTASKKNGITSKEIPSESEMNGNNV